MNDQFLSTTFQKRTQMYTLEKTCGILTTKKEFLAVKNAETMAFIKHNFETFESVYQEVAYAQKNTDGTYHVEIIACWVSHGPTNSLVAVEPVSKLQNPDCERTVANVKAKSPKEAILSVVKPIVYNRG
jgi:hypothetical protein